ncbi:MAG: ComF family protein [Clostridia bacterium]|nr:ComF family protein [Clostridia bacterium]
MIRIFKSILDLAFVPKCAICNTRLRDSSKGLCSSCFEKYEDEKAKYCDFCGMEARICACTPHLMMINGCSDYRKLVFYSSDAGRKIARGIVYSLKRRHNIPLAEFVASEISQIDNAKRFDGAVVTYCPRSVKNVKKYGYDHAKMLAQFFAEKTGLEFESLIRRKKFHKTTEQKNLNYKQREANLKGAFSLTDEKLVEGKTIILIDDVVTSGATISECMALLYSAGAKDVICRSFAYTYRKNKSKKD